MITGGQNFVSSPPAFSNDGKKLLVCTGNTISIFSTSTGMQITELEGHTALVTSVIVVPVAARESKYMCFCWSSSLDGTICYWDFLSPELIKKVKVDLPIWSMAIPNISCPQAESNGKQSNLHAFVTVEDVKKPADQYKALHGQIMLYNLTKARRVGGLLAETHKPEAIAVSNSGEFLGIKNKRKLHIWKVPVKDFKFKELKKIKLHHTKMLSALAFHPTENMVAGGDVTGRILIWRGFGKKTFTQDARKSSGGNTKYMEEKPGVRGDDDADTCSTWHWHPTEVKFLTFSSDGAYLYSGGKEGVIVVWQLDSGKKKFKPRLGSPLLYYTQSPDPSLSCISCADNQIHMLRMPSMEILKSISGIKLPFPFPEGYEGLNSGFAFDHGAGIVALRTEAYCIQFFSLFDDIEVSQVQVCERNYQPVDEITVVVALLALSTDGSIMATVEVKLSEEGIGGLVRLKFWAHGSRAGEYSLSTVIYEPHSDAGISALEFCPNRSMAVSSSYGGDFKIWVHSSGIEQKDQMLQGSGWRCQSVGSYRKKPMTAAAFSADGSILAVAAESVVTLWDPNKNILVAVIGETLAPIVKLSFVGKSEYLVTLSRGMKPQLAVWNMSKLSIAWSYNIFAEAVTSTEVGTHFAILALPPRSSDDATKGDHDGVILLFDVENPVPIATWSAKKANGGGLAFTPARLNSQAMEVAGGKAPTTLLAYINGNHEFILFDPYSSEERQIFTGTCGSHTAVEETELFGYASIYGELPEFDLKKEQIPMIPFVPSEKPWETIFSGSSQVLPPLTKLCAAFLASLLEKKQSVK